MNKAWAWLCGIALLVAPFVFFARGTRMEVLLGDGDAFVQFLPFWTYAARQWQDFTAPFWTPHIFGGFPLFAEPQASVFHPLKLLFFFFSPLAALNITVLLYYGLAGLFTFLFAREEGLSLEAGLLAGLSFPFCGFLIGHQAITALFITAASFPLSFYVLRRVFQKNDYTSILGGALAVVFLVLGGHPQFTFYSLFFGLFYAAYLLLFVAEENQKKCFLKSVLAMYVLGVALSAFQLLPTFELMTYSVREKLTYQDFVAISLHFPTLLTSLISTRLYHVFPNDGSEAMVDVGMMVLVLAALGGWLARRRAAFWIFLTLFSSLLFVGSRTPLYELMFWVPGYNLFRVASRNGIILDFAIIMLAAHGLNAIQQSVPSARWYRRVVALVLIPVLYYFSIYLMENRIFDRLLKAYLNRGEPLPWKWGMAREHLLPLFPELSAFLGGAVLIAFLLSKSGGGKLPALLSIALAFTHFWEYRNWIFVAPADQVKQSLTAAAIPEVVKEAGGPYRIALGTPYSWINFLQENQNEWRRKYVAAGGVDINMLHRVHSISGYTPLILSDYSRLAGAMHMSGSINEASFFSSPALDLLNVKYVFVPPGGLGFPAEVFSRLERIGETELFTIYHNPRARGMFWAVEEVKTSSPERFWKELHNPNIDFGRTALLMEGSQVSDTLSSPQVLEVEQPNANSLRVNVETSGPAFLASSCIWYPGWLAWIDEKRVPVYRINGLFTGIAVPSGNHTIVLKFVPLSFWGGTAVALIAAIGFAIVSKTDLLGFRQAGSERSRQISS